MRIDRIIFMSALMLTCVLSSPLYSFGSLDSENKVLQFADYLYEKGDYYRAITEYERYSFLLGKEDIPAVQHRIAMCYYMGGKFQDARRMFQGLILAGDGSDVSSDSRVMLADCSFQTGEYNVAAGSLREMAENDRTGLFAVKLAWCELWGDAPTAALVTLGDVSEDAESFPLATKLIERVELYSLLPSKSPSMAGAMSMVLPGAGQAYVGRYRDAAVSFFINGVTIWAALEAFENDEDVAGSFAAFLEFGWYSGNIYNAVSSAHKFNRSAQEDYLRRVGLQYSISIAEDKNKELRPIVGVSTSF